jgi:hypothetical protein
MVKLKKNERLVYAGDAMLRGPDGAIIPNVPQYAIVSASEADPEAVATVGKNERVILAGKIFDGLRNARERFAAKKAGLPMPPKEEGTPLYVLEGAESVNPKTGFTHEEERAIRALGKDMLTAFSMQMRERGAAGFAAARPGKSS